MRRIAAALWLLGCGATQAAEPGTVFITGDEWLGMYESGEPGREAAAAYAAGYVDGVLAAAPESRRRNWCLPDAVTELELADAVARYLAGKPVFSRMGAPFILDRALAEAWPCR